MQKQDWHSAQVSLEERLENLPRDGEAHLKLAKVYGELDSIDRMLITLERARSLSPNHIKPANFIAEKYWFKNFNLGLKKFEQKLFDESVRRFQLAVRIEPTNTHSLQRLADALFMGARYQESEKNYMRVLAQQPGNLAVKDNLSEICFIEKKFSKAIELCNEILSVKPFAFKALVRRAYSYEAMGAFEEAEKDFSLLADMNPTTQLLTDLGMMYFRNGKYEASIKRFTEALHVSSEKLTLYRCLGEANWYLGNYKSMVLWYEKLVESLPNDLQGWKKLALAYESLGQKEMLSIARTHIGSITGTN
ncbi:MAG: tetratricopeptide repeat protein [bacterium]